MFQYDDYDVMTFSEYSVMDESQNYEMYDSADFAVAYAPTAVADPNDPNAPVVPESGLSTFQKILLYGGAGLGALGTGGAAYLALKNRGLQQELGNVGKTAKLAKDLGMYNAAQLGDDAWSAITQSMKDKNLVERLTNQRKALQDRLARIKGAITPSA